MSTNIKNYLDSDLFKEQKIKDILNRLDRVIQQDSNIFLWVSWGMDSVIMALVIVKYFKKNTYDFDNIHIVHFNHGTRRSNEHEQQFIKELFQDFDLHIFNFKQDIKDGNREDDKQNEANMRKRRYSNFAKLTNSDTDMILLGHNLTDRIESSFMNMLRWCHLNGFISMNFLQQHSLINNKQVCRPLLYISKMEVYHLCEKYWIQFVQDESNFDPTVSLRNRIRIEILNKMYTLANDNGVDSNSFLESYKNVFDELENVVQSSDLVLEDLPQNKYRDSKWAWKRVIEKEKITETTFVNLLKQIWIYSNISKPMLTEFVNFFINSDSWYKFFNWACFFITNQQVYVIIAEDKFWEKNLENLDLIQPKEINGTWDYIFDWNVVRIKDESLVWLQLRYTKKWDKLGSKNLSREFSNKKIAIFERNFIIVIADWDNVKKYFYNGKLN